MHHRLRSPSCEPNAGWRGEKKERECVLGDASEKKREEWTRLYKGKIVWPLVDDICEDWVSETIWQDKRWLTKHIGCADWWGRPLCLSLT